MTKKKRDPSKTELAVNLMVDLTKFLDQFNEPYIILPRITHKEIHPLNSNYVKNYIASKLYETCKTTITKSGINDVITLLSGQAQSEGLTKRLNNRVAWDKENICYDLSNSKWEVVEIKKSGWNITEKYPMFRRYGHQKSQATPTKEKTFLREVFDLFKIDEKDKALLEIITISYFIPDFPHPILVVHGPQGSTKTTLIETIKEIVDPSQVKSITMPKEADDLRLMLYSHYFAPFDNISYISKEKSDDLCRAVTGTGLDKRKLYTDNERIIYTFKHCTALNGINAVPGKPDLLDRCIIIGLERIGEKERMPERVFWKKIEEMKPGILGYIFSIVSEAMKISEEFKPEDFDLPRMADFGYWGEIISRAMGYNPGEFLKNYNKNIAEQHSVILENHPIGLCLLYLIRNNKIFGAKVDDETKEAIPPGWADGEWFGTPSQLLNVLTGIAQELGINTRSKYFPEAPHILSRRLNELKVNLKEFGWILEEERGEQRIIYIRPRYVADDNKKGEGNGSYDAKDANDSLFPIPQSHTTQWLNKKKEDYREVGIKRRRRRKRREGWQMIDGELHLGTCSSCQHQTEIVAFKEVTGGKLFTCEKCLENRGGI